MSHWRWPLGSQSEPTMHASPISLPQPAPEMAPSANPAAMTTDLIGGRILAVGTTTGKARRLLVSARCRDKLAQMRAVVQRVSRASVTVDGRITGSIERGLLVL